MRELIERIDFGNEAADDVDVEELADYFVEQASFYKYTNSANRVLVATARKGVGKSALLQWISHKIAYSDPDALVIKCRGADIVRNKFNLTSALETPNDYIRDWMIRICALVNRELAVRLKLGVDDDRLTLIETAELEGYKSRNLVGCLVDRLQGLIPKGLPTKVPIKEEIEMLKRVSDRKVYIIIDDLDATFQSTPKELLELSTFFSACRYIAQDINDIYFRATMRTEVWAMIRRYDESLDKMEQYVGEILWSLRDFRRLLYMRISSQIEKLGIRLPEHKAKRHTALEEDIIKYVFVPKMQWAEKLVSTSQVIYTLSYERPRWGIQLCKLAQANAIQGRLSVISKDNIDNVWGEYGNKRIADLVAEHKHQCKDIEELLTGFRGCERLLTRGDLFSWITRRITNHMAPNIEGTMTRSPREIARFLYRLGFIVARSDDEYGNYEHYRFEQMPDFLTSRTDDDFGLKWEIHPCYREALDIVKLDRSHRERFKKARRLR